MTHAQLILTIIGSAVAICVVIAGGIRWVFRKGFSLSKIVNSIDKNTEATGNLADSFKVYTEKADGHILDHEKRITRLEAHEDTRGRQNKQP